MFVLMSPWDRLSSSVEGILGLSKLEYVSQMLMIVDQLPENLNELFRKC